MSTRATRPAATQRTDRHVNGILTSGLAFACRYAADRPDCQVLASIRYGQIALCARCDQRRSTVGKATTPVRLPDPGTLIEVAAARDAARQAEADLRRTVAQARQADQPWSAIAAILGVSRQAAQQRYAQPSPDQAMIAGHRQIS